MSTNLNSGAGFQLPSPREEVPRVPARCGALQPGLYRYSSVVSENEHDHMGNTRKSHETVMKGGSAMCQNQGLEPV